MPADPSPGSPSLAHADSLQHRPVRIEALHIGPEAAALEEAHHSSVAAGHHTAGVVARRHIEVVGVADLPARALVSLYSLLSKAQLRRLG